MEYIPCKSKFTGRCGTINVDLIHNAALENKGFECFDPTETYHYLIPAKELEPLVDAGDIEWKIVDGVKIINEVGFKGNRPNTGYGRYFKKELIINHNIR